jgi:Ran GTPase-activating protein (RanGAP) involved in mRNA processing and transport
LTKFDISKNGLCAAGAKALAEALRGNKVMTEFNASGNYLGKMSASPAAPDDMSGVIMLADVIPSIGALLKLDTSDNYMFGMPDKTGITAWADGLKASTSITELNLAKNCINKDDAKIFARAISDTRALNSLNLSQNSLLNEESGHVLALALIANSALTELDVSKNFELTNESSQDGSGFAVSFAYCLKTNKNLKTLDISFNNIPFSDDLFTSMSAIKKVLAEGNNYLSVENPCLKVLCEEKVLEMESIAKIDLHSQKLTGQLLAVFCRIYYTTAHLSPM